MNFKPIALVVIGVLLGSTVALTLTRPSTSTAEILACTNKSTGVVRLLRSGNCDMTLEIQSNVDNLETLFPTSSLLSPATTEARPTQKFVIDSTGKNIGQLVIEEGIESYIVRTKNGIWALGVSYPQVRGFLTKIDFFFDSKCQRPYLVGFEKPEKLLHTAIDDQQKLIGYVASTGPLSRPTTGWVIQTTRDPETEVIRETNCVQWNKEDPLEVETGAQFFKSVKVPLVSYTPPLKIVEK